ncbi:MAG: 50S ribosomal protein L3 N(5)-glutamine methyltransferase [Gammaproteobacteria bacterium]|nr:MAG: 50S ribosomal protein L3 N(5)-glutamine methyltransferase [Gammaproteobacteria bacterium]
MSLSLYSPLSISDQYTVQQLIEDITAKLDTADIFFGHGVDNALDEAVWLVSSQLHFDAGEIDDQLGQTVDAGDQQKISDILQRRINEHIPLAYLLKETWFGGYKFYIDERVIVPRSHIVSVIEDRFEPWSDSNNIKHVLDLCTGSGCIAIAIAHAFADATVDAVELSPGAIEVANINVRQHGLQHRVNVIHSDLFSELSGNQYDLIVSNPPYVGTEEMQSLPNEFLKEPNMALETGDEGLEIALEILAEAGKYLTPNGLLVMEVGNTAHALQQRFPDVPFMWLATYQEEDTVFALTTEELQKYADIFLQAINT